MLRRLVPLLALFVALLAVAPPARAASGLEVGIEDDDALLLRMKVGTAFQGYWGNAPFTYDVGKDFRASYMRLIVGWSDTLPPSQVKLKKAPKTKKYTWAMFDRTIDMAKARGYK